MIERPRKKDTKTLTITIQCQLYGEAIRESYTGQLCRDSTVGTVIRGGYMGSYVKATIQA